MREFRQMRQSPPVDDEPLAALEHMKAVAEADKGVPQLLRNMVAATPILWARAAMYDLRSFMRLANPHDISQAVVTVDVLSQQIVLSARVPDGRLDHLGYFTLAEGTVGRWVPADVDPPALTRRGPKA